jgi:DNA primase
MAERSEIDEVRSRTDIVSTIEQHVTLKRAGRNLKGLCPFHNEKTPSFQVNPDIGVWKCFGCGEGGDVIKFVQKIENLSFVEALERLALRAGITLSQTDRNGSPRIPSVEVGERDRIYKVNGLALRYYLDMLAKSEVAQAYLTDRKIKADTQLAFCIGYAPDSWDALTLFLTNKGVPIADAELAGLVGRSDRGSAPDWGNAAQSRVRYYDRLRGRIIFPIFDVHDQPIAFGGRLLAPATAGQPKYWNSPEQPAFQKSKTLYGIDKARKAIKDQGFAIVVEGYTDVVSTHQEGFQNVVAPLGTALTEEHVRTLARLAPSVVLCFDADSAGLKAAFRAGEIFEANEIAVKVLSLPDGEDPDSLLRAGRREEFLKAISNAVPLMEYRVRRLIRSESVRTDDDRIGLLRKAVPILASVKSVIEREQYINMIAPYHPRYRHGSVIAEQQIRQDVASYAGGQSRGREARRSDEGSQAPAAMREATDIAERHLIRALLSGDPGLRARVVGGAAPDEFVTEQGTAIAQIVFEALRRQPDMDAAVVIGTVKDENLSAALTSIVMGDDGPLSIAQVDGEIRYLKRKSTERERTRLKELVDRGAATADDLRQYIVLNGQLKGSEMAATT